MDYQIYLFHRLVGVTFYTVCRPHDNLVVVGLLGGMDTMFSNFIALFLQDVLQCSKKQHDIITGAGVAHQSDTPSLTLELP